MGASPPDLCIVVVCVIAGVLRIKESLPVLPIKVKATLTKPFYKTLAQRFVPPASAWLRFVKPSHDHYQGVE